MPLLTIYAWLALVYAWQAWLVPSPSIFPDELQYAELARAIAEDGRPALRGVEQGFASLPSWLTAPAWLASSTEDGYLAAKLIGVLAMAAVVFPAYGLARLVAPRGPALWAAVAAGTIPAVSYSALLMEEPFAYPAATLASTSACVRSRGPPGDRRARRGRGGGLPTRPLAARRSFPQCSWARRRSSPGRASAVARRGRAGARGTGWQERRSPPALSLRPTSC